MGKKKLVETRCSPCYINNLFTHLERHNEQAKLAEIEAIGFDFLHRVPQWHVKQSIMLQLAKAYDVKTNTLRVDAGDIRITAELIGNVFGIPSRGDPISELQKKMHRIWQLRESFRRKLLPNYETVFACPMETEQQRMTFRRYFSMVPVDYFSMAPPSDIGCLEPKKISLAVSDIKMAARCDKEIPRREPRNMRRVHVRVAVARSKSEENSSARTPTSRHLLGARQNLSIGISKRRRKLPVRRSRSRSGTKKVITREIVPRSNAAPLVVPDSDDEDNVPLARRIQLFEQQHPPHDVKQAEPAFKGKHKGARNKGHNHSVPTNGVAKQIKLSYTESMRLSFSLGLTQLEKDSNSFPDTFNSSKAGLRGITKEGLLDLEAPELGQQLSVDPTTGLQGPEVLPL
ncbi:uncharacterized protein DS421_16g552060 [Arachis hypogaea]|nr:uncharacterized protein DS421_16g552060 [Arachis hypogaea]